jgi:hypothetical protein
MTILEATRQADALRHNTFTQEEKLRWLSQVDAMVHQEVIGTHEGGEPFRPYDAQTPLDQQLLVPHPFDELYLHYLEAQMGYYQAESERYNRAMGMYQAVMTAFANHYNRTHLPKTQAYRYF